MYLEHVGFSAAGAEETSGTILGQDGLRGIKEGFQYLFRDASIIHQITKHAKHLYTKQLSNMIPDTPTSPTFFDATSRTPTTTMASEKPFERSLDQLQTPEQLKLVDTIEELRNRGLGQLGIDLPQLIVCGDQSSGKSSLLEGLTRLRFPIDDEQCTTFATEVVLRRELSFNITCTIIPGKSRSPKDRKELGGFKQSFSSSKDFQLPLVIKDAKEIMTRGLPKGQSGVVEDVLRVQYSGPDLPSLTIVDLPGMIEDKVEGADDEADRILELVTSYMQNEKTIILAVIHTGSHFDNQKVFKQLKIYDPQYKRTLGIITKPDRIDSGSPEEKKLIRVAKNEQYPFQHRWHAVRNRSSKHNKQSDTERDEIERKFFDTGLWACVRRQDVGIESLRAKLSRVLLEHVIKELPSIVKAVQLALTSKRASLRQLGDARETSKDQRSYLISHAQDFHSLTQDALRGVYTNPFFGISSPDKQSSARLRTAVQNLNMAFADVMIRKGNKWYIPADRLTVDQSSHFEAWDLTTQEYDAKFEDPQYKDRADFLDNHIGGYVRQSRQAGLPSVINPLVIGEVFREMSEKWRDIATHHLHEVFSAIQLYVETALQSLMDTYTFKLLMLKHVQPSLDRRWEKVEEKLEELLVPFTEQDPLTYDPGFAKTVKDLRVARYSAEQTPGTLGKQQSFGFKQSNPSKPSSDRNQRLLTESLDEFTNSDILDLVTTYYKVRTT
ncbi:P-loop containing nucleoside triphosphate hydrolase protein [Paraphoma chrysanthemicola]|uniref:P-loop containing nucleoside triphosphate hydrolase protein n=1 Tax=Paraphoma chrysanthemicola TaxID=798071 RepID=A0A8K0VRY2_9PLEO|nr:P-loop containing nucleoside triphosphate hydrolase protein [Paraphoma chrysanthemicola]